MKNILLDGISEIAKIYAPISEKCKADIEQFAQIKIFKKNEFAVREGQYSSIAYFIITGSARVFYIKDGKEITDWFVFEKDFLCPLNSFYLNLPSPDYIQFNEKSTVIAINRDSIEILCKKHHEFDTLLRLIITKQMLRLQQRIVSIQFETASQKYDQLIALNPTIENRFSLGKIASFLGVTQETLSRIRGKS